MSTDGPVSVKKSKDKIKYPNKQKIEKVKKVITA